MTLRPTSVLHIPHQCKLWFVLITGLLSVTGLFVSYAPVAGAVSNVGYVGPSVGSAAGSPSGGKAESKLWWNDGFWWASMFHSSSSTFHIFKLNLATQTWLDTGTVLDTRANSRADALWDTATGKLYIASHVFTDASVPATTSNAGKLWRFSYNTATNTYTPDAGFPVDINAAKTETLVIDKDSTGQLWATWVQQTTTTSGVYKVYVNRTTTGDTAWGTPFELPTAGTTVAQDDIASLVAFDGNKIGVMWSNQLGSTMDFAIHSDTQADTTWIGPMIAYSGSNNADDHINLKSFRSDPQGRVFTAIKTSRTGSTDPLVLLAIYNRSTNTWSNTVFGTVADSHTRPVILLDQANNTVHMFATSDQSGGSIYNKNTSLTMPSFVAGRGTPYIEESATPGTSGDLNNGTSTKQPVSCVTGIVVLATNDTTRRYWHNYVPIPRCGSSATAYLPVVRK